MSLDVRQFEAGEIVFRMGDEAVAAYVIERGAVEILITKDGEFERINMLGPGALFGEIALLDGGTRTATVRTLAATHLIAIQRSQLESLLAKAEPVVQYIVRILLEHVRRASGGAPGEARTLSELLALAVKTGETPELADKLKHEATRMLTLATNLVDAIAEGQLELHYQPIVNFTNRRLAGFEALIRWRHPTLGMVRPDEFIPLAEKTDLIHRIGEFVVQQALADWPMLKPLCDGAVEGATPFMSINLSAPEFCKPDAFERIAQSLKTHRMAPQELRIELTETVIISNVEVVSEVIHRLRGLGVGIALDDFGKGYGGLDYLQSLPFSCLKIDKSFVDKMHQSDRSKQIIQSTLELSSRLGMSTVAEGIEDKPTADLLAQMGCVYAQGYYFARPMSIPAIREWDAARQA